MTVSLATCDAAPAVFSATTLTSPSSVTTQLSTNRVDSTSCAFSVVSTTMFSPVTSSTSFFILQSCYWPQQYQSQRDQTKNNIFFQWSYSDISTIMIIKRMHNFTAVHNACWIRKLASKSLYILPLLVLYSVAQNVRLLCLITCIVKMPKSLKQKLTGVYQSGINKYIHTYINI